MTSASRLPFCLATILLLSGCGLYWNQFGPELHLYDGPREAHEVATIDQGAGCYTCVQFIRRFDQEDLIYKAWGARRSGLQRPNRISVLPRKYEVGLGYEEGHGNDYTIATGYVDFQPGRTYQVLIYFFYGREKFVWMEDADTGEVVLGRKKDYAVEDPYAGQENPDRFSIIRAEREAEWCKNGLTEYCN